MAGKINILKRLDPLLGTPLIYVTRLVPIRKHPACFDRFLFIRPGGIGDAVLLLPAIDILRNKFPEATIDVLCEKRNHEIFLLKKAINKIYLYDRGLELFLCLRNKYDTVIDTEQWHRLSAVVAYFTGAGIRIGFDTNERARLFTHRITYSHDDYEVESFLRLIEPITGSLEDFKMDKPFIDIPCDLPNHLLPLSLIDSERLISISPGASVKERKWGGERFGEVAAALSAEGFRIVILGSNTDKDDARLINNIAKNCIDLTGKTNLINAASILKKSRLLIAADSGLMHIAFAVGTPTISLFGSGIENKWAPKGKRHIIINKHLPCSPCTRFGYTPKCNKNAACLSSISADVVIDAAGTFLGLK